MKNRFHSRWLVAAALVLWVGPAAQSALPAQLPNGQPLPSLAPMLAKVNPAVVNIATHTTTAVRNPLLEDPFFRRFFNVPDRRRYRRTRSAGSGVIVDGRKGHIVTNNHVVARADEVDITLSDGRVLNAELIGADPEVDLAVLKVDARQLAEIEFGDSDALRVGDFVVAIGNPFGLNQTVTSGIVSALGRSGLGLEGFEDFIQTDASINPGNSGGALVDLSGALVGINAALYSPAGVNVGIGFAIPANLVRAVMDQIIEYGEVRRGYLGLEVQDLNPDLAEAFGVGDKAGVVVVAVAPSGAAAGAIETGDVITRIGDREVREVGDFHSQTASVFVGDQLEVEILRAGSRRDVRIAVEEDLLEKVAGELIDPRLAGTELQNFRDEEEASAGVLVTGIENGCRAWEAGLRQGDVLVAVNRKTVRELKELRENVGSGAQQILLRVYRSGRFGYVAIR
ncbi:MAG: Do family serine endopeptidase [Gammaproteobacteria bacterium]|nr:Do family serine endopeptidase [Gammaproteobacteria bacterium]